jgi:hypothetical protein
MHCQRTNDRLYESKLSREMLNGSVSASRLRWFEEVVETLDLECQKLGFSCCGEGWRKCQYQSRTKDRLLVALKSQSSNVIGRILRAGTRRCR